MQENDREAFDVILAEIFAAIDKPLGEAQRSVFWKGLKDLGIVEFARIRDLLVSEFRDREDPPRKFTIGDIWSAKRRLRASVPQPPKDDGWRGDEWDQRANQRLLSYVLKAALRHEHFDERKTWILVAHKNRWAELFRGLSFDDVPMLDQDHAWKECMGMAEAEMPREKAA